MLAFELVMRSFKALGRLITLLLAIVQYVDKDSYTYAMKS